MESPARNFLKYLALIVALLSAFPVYSLYFILVFFLNRDSVFSGFSQLLSLFPGLFGKIMRRGFYLLSLNKCSSKVTIDFGTYFPTPDMILGKHVYIGAYCIISSCIIEDDVIIGSGVHLANKNMHYFNSLDKPIRLQGGKRQQIRIGKDTWIGNKAIIMADVGNHCVVGAGSVVVQPLEDRSIAMGNPARVIRKRMEL
jgi:virginiamycin A acetyltransferase